jgi:hypothetical protein
MALVKLVFTAPAAVPALAGVDQAEPAPELSDRAPLIPARPASVVPVPAEAFTRKAVA